MPRKPARHPFRRLSAGVSLGAMIGIGLSMPATLFSADHVRRSFDIPAGDAVASLKRFAAQAGEQVLYSPDDVGGIETQSVRGEYAPIAALERMLHGTPLRARHDEKAKAIAITSAVPSRRSPEAAVPADPPLPRDLPNRSDDPPRMMNRKNPITLFTGWLALALSPLASASAADQGMVAATRATGAITGRVQNVATGQYLNNARIAVRGTDLVAFTDETGTYRLREVPAGTVTLEVFYTGLDLQSVALDIPPGQTVSRDVDLTSVARYGSDSVVKLDAFTVSSSRETDAAAIAINEQRFAPNIKNVVAADSLGDVMDGNIGEFMKFIPGVIPEYDYEDGTTVSSVSIRGFSPHMVNVSTDGAQIANTSNAMGDSRSFAFNQASINNISRIEVTKVPTPSNRADALSGSVNMISKSAFERKTMQLRYNLNFAANSENFTFQRTPHTTEERVHKILPGGNFDLTLPINPRFGIVLTGSASDRYAKLHYSYNTYNASAANTGATPARPYLQTYRLLDSPRVLTRRSAGIKADWRVTPNSVLSAGVQLSHFESKRIATEFNINVGTNPTPTPATGTRLSFGEDYVIGATGRGSMTTGGAASVHPVMDNTGGNLRYRYDNGTWRVQTGFDQSRAYGGYRDTAEGHFRQMAIGMRVPVRVTFRDIGRARPGVIEVFDNNDNPVDYLDVNSYQLNTANSTPRRTDDRFKSGFLDVRRDLGFVGFPAAVQLGANQRVHTRDIRRWNRNWTYNGINGDRSPAPFLSPLYTNEYHYYGFRGFPHISPKLAWEAFQRNPALFSRTAAQFVTEETFRINNSQFFEEAVTAGYIQAEFSLFRYRLKVLTGVRYEETETKGQGALVNPSAVWLRNPDGSFARNAAGQRIRRPEAGAANSIEQLALTHLERGYRASRQYDGYYPSLHLNYNVSENLIARAAWARTYGRPNLNDIIPTATVDDADLDADEIGDPSVVQGNITVRNTGLRPWTADNFDLSLEYYTSGGGLYSAGVFLKEITNFFGNSVRIATLADTEMLGLDPRYVGWRVSTKVNSGDARVLGAEFNVKHSLRELGPWGRYFNVFVNGTKLDLQGDRDADFSGFTPESLNWGFSYTRRPVMFMAKWNYRGKRSLAAFPGLGPDAFRYDDRRLTLDLNAELQIRKTIFLYAAAQNVFNVPARELRYGSDTPTYAKVQRWGYNGVGITVGLKGTF
jgi:iron complex outermembrane recepter protein